MHAVHACISLWGACSSLWCHSLMHAVTAWALSFWFRLRYTFTPATLTEAAIPKPNISWWWKNKKERSTCKARIQQFHSLRVSNRGEGILDWAACTWTWNVSTHQINRNSRARHLLTFNLTAFMQLGFSMKLTHLSLVQCWFISHFKHKHFGIKLNWVK